MNQKILNYYSQFSQYTDPGLYKDLFKVLPDEIESIGSLVLAQLIHRYDLDNIASGITKSPWYRQCEDDNFPTVAAILAELYRRNRAGFIKDRLLQDRLVLTCRFVAILTASILKSKGIPARVRAGFAPYFCFNRFQGKSATHFIDQYWNNKEKRWITIDVDARSSWPGFNPYDISEGSFDFPADVWLDVRSGKEDGKRFCHFRISDLPALPLIASKLFHDFFSLMNSESSYLHLPKKINFENLANFSKLAGGELKEIDQLAYLMQNPDKNFEKLQEVWETNRDFRFLTGALLSQDGSLS